MDDAETTQAAGGPLDTPEARTYTAGYYERHGENGQTWRHWVLLNQYGDILVNERSEQKFWRRVEQFLSLRYSWLLAARP